MDSTWCFAGATSTAANTSCMNAKVADIPSTMPPKKLQFEAKQKMISLAGACFWYWNSFLSFLDSCGVSTTLQRKYPQGAYNKYEMLRAVLGDLEQAGDFETINAIASGFYRLRDATDPDKLDPIKARLLLNEFRELLGSDPVDLEIERRAREAAKGAHGALVQSKLARDQQLSALNRVFVDLHSTSTVTPQARGYKLEDIIFELLRLSEFEFTKPYRHSGEQIDGHFRYEKFDYLVEAKWTAGPAEQNDLSVFDGKIRGKAQSTRGMFISANGFVSNAIEKYSGDAPRIILMSGEDLALILSGQVLFTDAMKAKVDAIVRHGRIFLPIREIAT